MRKPNTTEGTGSVRRDSTVRMAMEMGLGEGIWALDCYNGAVMTDGICFAVTTRISACNNYFLLEINEKDFADKCDE